MLTYSLRQRCREWQTVKINSKLENITYFRNLRNNSCEAKDK